MLAMVLALSAATCVGCTGTIEGPETTLPATRSDAGARSGDAAPPQSPDARQSPDGGAAGTSDGSLSSPEGGQRPPPDALLPEAAGAVEAARAEVEVRPEAPPPLSASHGTIVPLYTYPTDPSWQALVTAKQRHPAVPVIAIINPANGPGSGPNPNRDYVAGIQRLHDAGIMVMGYVWTGYARRPESAVQADIDRYRLWYPPTTGIFFDEQAYDSSGPDYYRRLTAYAKASGFTYTVGNPGRDTSPGYVGSVDLILIYENEGLPSPDTLGGWHLAHDRRGFGIIPWGVPSLDDGFVAMAKQYVGTIYVTSDLLPNPWDSVPAYLDDLLSALEP